MDARLSMSTAGGDLVLEGGDLARDEGLVTAALVSLLSDGRAPAVQSRPPLDQDLRGYWGEARQDPYGSLLWTLGREKATAATAARAREAVTSALQWLVVQGIAASIEAQASYLASGVLALDVKLVRGTARRWASLWQKTFEARLSAGGLLLKVQVG